MYISKRLKELRTLSGFSQEKLAELLDVSRQTIQVGKMKGAILMFTI